MLPAKIPQASYGMTHDETADLLQVQVDQMVKRLGAAFEGPVLFGEDSLLIECGSTLAAIPTETIQVLDRMVHIPLTMEAPDPFGPVCGRYAPPVVCRNAYMDVIPLPPRGHSALIAANTYKVTHLLDGTVELRKRSERTEAKRAVHDFDRFLLVLRLLKRAFPWCHSFLQSSLYVRVAPTTPTTTSTSASSSSSSSDSSCASVVSGDGSSSL
jgi:hypothetical protein